MKTIADQYKLVTEGKLGQFQFMRNVRLTFPQFVTNVTSFNDAVKILKNKSIISEAKLHESIGERLAEETAEEVNNMIASGELTQEQGNAIDDYLNDNSYELFNSGDFDSPYKVIEYVLTQIQPNTSLNENKNTSSEWCNPQEYDLGIRYELGKGTDEEKAHKIVYKNLKDNAAYYSQLHLAGYNEDAMKKDRSKRTDVPIEVKTNNTVDTSNGTKKVKVDKLTEDELKIIIGKVLNEVLENNSEPISINDLTYEKAIEIAGGPRFQIQTASAGTNSIINNEDLFDLWKEKILRSYDGNDTLVYDPSRNSFRFTDQSRYDREHDLISSFYNSLKYKGD